VLHQADLYREQRVTAHEGLGAVDRIDQPEILGIGLFLSQLFAVETVIGEASSQHLLDRTFGGDVDFRHRTGVGLVAHREITAVGIADDLAGGSGGVECGDDVGAGHEAKGLEVQALMIAVVCA